MVGRWIAMRPSCKPLLLGGLLVGLGACTTALPPEKIQAMRPPLPFNEEIKEGYLRLAETEGDQTLFGDGYHFHNKAREAMLGDTVWPDKVASRQIPKSSQIEAIELRERLIRALEGGARETAPADAAAAQLNFDCWLVELEWVKDPTQRSDCHDSFLAALTKAESTLVHTPYTVFFDPGSDRVGPDGMNEVTYALRAARIAQPAAIAVTGYADPSGDSRANQALSQRRAEAVAEALRAGKPPASTIDVAARGATPGTTGEQARRVEITFGG